MKRLIALFFIILTVSLPSPVHAATQLLGTSTAGGNPASNTLIVYQQFTASASGTLSIIKLYCLVNGNAKAAIYSDSGSNTPNAQLAVNNTGVALTAGAWRDVTMTTPVSVTSGTKYWLSCVIDTFGTVAYRSTTGTLLYNQAGTYAGGLPATASATYDSVTTEISLQGWAISAPAIVTQAASAVASTTAQLNATVTDDGGQVSDVRFAYDNVTRANFTDYANITAWVSNTYGTGDNPSVAVTSLTAATTYYFRAQIANDSATVTGDELNFLTSNGVGVPASIVAVCNSSSISLNWVKGTGAATTLVRYRAGSYPATTSDGTVAYLGAGESKILTGLTAGTTYYFSAWGLTGGLYSATYASTLGTTTAFDSASNTAQKLVQPTPDSTWTQTPSSTKLATIPVFGQLVQDNATAYQQPVNYLWFFIWMLIAAGIFVVVYIKGQYNYLLAAFCSLGFIGVGVWWYNIVAGGIVILIGIIGIAWALVGFRRTGT